MEPTKETKHSNICSNGCGFATKAIQLSFSGSSEDWLYRCTKIDKVIHLDSVIYQVGCATYSTGTCSTEPGKLVQEAEALLGKINKEIEEGKKNDAAGKAK